MITLDIQEERVCLSHDERETPKKRRSRGGSRGELNVGDRVRSRWSRQTGLVLEIEPSEDPRLITVQWQLSVDVVEEDQLIQISSNDKPILTRQSLERLLRNFFEFKELYEREGVEELTLDGGFVVNYHDLLKGIEELPSRQREALVLVCIHNMREVDAAREMGFERWSSQVGSYKRIALDKLLKRHWNE